jgi:hypothetical protein
MMMLVSVPVKPGQAQNSGDEQHRHYSSPVKPFHGY